MTIYLVVSCLFTVIMAAVGFLSKKVSDMSASTDALTVACLSLKAQVDAVGSAVAELKSHKDGSLADAAAVDKATHDIQAAIAALQASVA